MSTEKWRVRHPGIGTLAYDSEQEALVAAGTAGEVLAPSGLSQAGQPRRHLKVIGPPLRVVPVTFRAAADYIAAHHRHNRPPRGMLFCLGVADEHRVLRGVAVVGRPVARMAQDGQTAEVLRCCTDGALNAPTMLYGAAWRAAKALGYTRLVTATRSGEGGASLCAAGWHIVATRRPHAGWNRPSRARQPNGAEGEQITIWELIAA